MGQNNFETMKKSIAIILVIFLYACKNDSEKSNALDFCLEQSENIINNENDRLIRQLELMAIDDPNFSNSFVKFQFKKVKVSFKANQEFEHKIIEMERINKVSLSNIKIAFEIYLGFTYKRR
ncbi:MAG: hypothetical protein ACOYMA_17310 [Bacteroidia bacterium]